MAFSIISIAGFQEIEEICVLPYCRHEFSFCFEGILRFLPFVALHASFFCYECVWIFVASVRSSREEDVLFRTWNRCLFLRSLRHLVRDIAYPVPKNQLIQWHFFQNLNLLRYASSTKWRCAGTMRLIGLCSFSLASFSAVANLIFCLLVPRQEQAMQGVFFVKAPSPLSVETFTR